MFVAISQHIGGHDHFKLYDTITLSSTTVSKRKVLELINKGADIKNLIVEGDKCSIDRESSLIKDRVYLGHINKGDEQYHLLYNTTLLKEEVVSYSKIKDFIENEVMCNVYIDSNEQLKSTIDEDYSNSKEFEESVQEKYNNFIAKQRLLGTGNEIKYVIRKNKVIMTHYIGDYSNIIIPEFIDIISQDLFFSHKIGSIQFQGHIEAIGDRAFAYSKFTDIDKIKGLKRIYNSSFNLDEATKEKYKHIIVI